METKAKTKGKEEKLGGFFRFFSKNLFAKFIFAMFFVCGFTNNAFADCGANQFEYNNTCIDSKFEITTTEMSANDIFKFQISAAGDFYIDCGNGGTFESTGNQIGTITRSDTTATLYTCNYTNGGTPTIRFGGLATGYNNTESLSISVAAIQFGQFSGNTATKIVSVSGSLGAVFPTLETASVGTTQPRFWRTFQDCTGLTELPSGLFDGVSGAAQNMFLGTFLGCTSLATIPPELFNGVFGAAYSMFASTFSGCTNLTSIPSGLFSGVSGAAYGVFSNTFSGCTSLKTVPYNLFAGASDIPGDEMFRRTFYNDSLLDTFVLANGSTVNYIPPEFFGSINGGPTSVMSNIFYNNTAIASSCPNGTIQNITGYESYWNNRVSCFVPTATVTLYQNNDSNDTTINTTVPATKGAYLSPTDTNGNTLTPPTRDEYIFIGYYNAKTGGTAYYDSSMQPINRWNSNGNGPLYAQWFSKTNEYKFAITTTEMNENDKFQFSISAAGNFVVDCGVDGIFESTGNQIGVINRTDTTMTLYTCNYANAGIHIISFDGLATGYSSTARISAIRFHSHVMAPTYQQVQLIPFINNPNVKKIASISGSLGAIFPTLETTTVGTIHPNFAMLFAGATNLTGLLPENLFLGVSTSQAEMFWGSFWKCSALTSLPSRLFNGISGNITSYMFFRTFADCTSLTTVPYNLFSGASGTPVDNMFGQTFYNDSLLNTFVLANGSTVNYIPPEFFGSINGGPTSVMSNIFYNNTAIASSCPANTYQNITGYESYWNGRVSCNICPTGYTSPAGSTDVSQCVAAPMTIINWYDGDTVVGTTSCSENEGIQLPEIDTNRAGYTFAGWKIKESAGAGGE